jgi:serine/alanine adding enzyme
VIHEQLSTIEDRDAWEEAMPAHISVFGSIGYARIVQRHIGYPARLFVVSSGAGRIVYPFFLRSGGESAVCEAVCTVLGFPYP